MVLRRCRFLLGDEDRALDAMQEVFVKILRYGDRLTAEYPSALLYRVATNICLNMIRDEGRRPDHGGTDIDTVACMDDAEERVLSDDYMDFLFRGENLTTREMALMHYVDGMTLAEVARESGLSVSAVRKRLAGLKTRLSSRLASEEQ